MGNEKYFAQHFSSNQDGIEDNGGRGYTVYKPFVTLSLTLSTGDWSVITCSHSLTWEHILIQAPLLVGTCSVELWGLHFLHQECQPVYQLGFLAGYSLL
ncbi:hypothetical protein FKM82_020911 [Ascaphus truei]